MQTALESKPEASALQSRNNRCRCLLLLWPAGLRSPTTFYHGAVDLLGVKDDREEMYLALWFGLRLLHHMDPRILRINSFDSKTTVCPAEDFCPPANLSQQQEPYLHPSLPRAID